MRPLSPWPFIIQRQACACGGACPRCQNSIPLQAKLQISEPGDAPEREADRMADAVMRMAAPAEPDYSEPRARHPSRVSRHASEPPSNAGHHVPPIGGEALRSPGQPLDSRARALMESRFEHDFSAVRVHTDAQASESAQSMHALAYTTGEDIVFAAGRYAPNSENGRWLLAHELTHVIQQRAANASAASHESGAGPADDPARLRAETPSTPPTTAGPAMISGAPRGVQRYQYDPECSGDHRSRIVGAHRLGEWATRRASTLLSQGAPSGALKGWFDFLFGNQAESQRAQIAANFTTLSTTMKGDFTYHCPAQGTKPCTGAQAEVAEDGDVSVCFDKVDKFSNAGMARLLVHETVRRAHGRRNVTNINDATGECAGAGGAKSTYVEATPDKDHPIPYSCFAEKVVTIYLAEKKQETDTLFQKLLGNGVTPTYWAGTMMVDGASCAVTVALNLKLVDLDFLVTGSYAYEHPQHGKTTGEIPFGIVKSIGPSGETEALNIVFDWREGASGGRGSWQSTSADEFKGKWGRGDSSVDGGSWTITQS